MFEKLFQKTRTLFLGNLGIPLLAGFIDCTVIWQNGLAVKVEQIMYVKFISFSSIYVDISVDVVAAEDISLK